MKDGKAKPALKLSMQGRNAVTGILFITPFLIGFLAFMVIPIFQSLAMVFSKVSLDLPHHRFALSFTGLDNLRWAFFEGTVSFGYAGGGGIFTRLLAEELGRMLLIVPAVIFFSIFAALMLNRKFPCRAAARAVFFLPVILSSGVIISIESRGNLIQQLAAMSRSETGWTMESFTTFLEELLFFGGGYLGMITQYVFAMLNQIYTITMASGIQIVIFLSALQTIPPSMYEAAEMEGCTAWECFWKITFPLMTPMILVNVIYSVVDYFLRTDNKVMLGINGQVALLDYGHSSAMTWAYFFIVMAVLGISGGLISRKVQYYE